MTPRRYCFSPAADGPAVAIAAVVVCLVGMSFAANPLVPHVGMADTNVHFHNGSFKIYATHDFSVNNTGFKMLDWWAWESSDLVSWRVASVIKPSVTFTWASGGELSECWATDGAFRNGKYYFYMSVGPAEVGVAVAESIHGPWKDPIGRPLLSDAMGKNLNPRTTFRDPCVFFEDNSGDYYIIAGVFKYYIAKLGEDMVSLAEPLQYVQVNNPYGPCGNGTTDDKPFLHQANGLFYLSWGCFYATSKSIYGPYDMQGSVIDTAMIAPAFRMNTTSRGVRGLSLPTNPSAPKVGDGIELYECNTASEDEWDLVAIAGTRERDGTTPTPSKFAVRLHSDPTLCITGGKVGEHLHLAECVEHHPFQSFSVRSTAQGADITNTDGCDCWNVNDDHARGPGNHGVNGALVQCYTCVDGGDPNPNQRFQLAGSKIQAWDGYAKGFCVSVADAKVNPTPPPPPPPPHPWFLRQDYTDRHGSFLSHGGQWFYASNDRSHSGDTGHPGVFRDTVMCYIHFRSNGTMEPCTIDAMGVGQYDATRRIQAENFFRVERGEKLDLRAVGGGDGFAVGDMRRGSRLYFPHVHFPRSPTGIQILAANGMRSSVNVTASFTTAGTVASGGQAAHPSPLSVQCAIPPSGGWSVYKETVCMLDAERLTKGMIWASELDMLLAITGVSTTHAGEAVRLDSFSFSF